jgi:hypothetical protein
VQNTPVAARSAIQIKFCSNPKILSNGLFKTFLHDEGYPSARNPVVAMKSAKIARTNRIIASPDTEPESARTSNKRFAVRKASDSPATIDTKTQVLGRDAPLIPCIIEDSSSTGAKLRLKGATASRWTDGANGLPDKFFLRIAAEGIEVPCEVVWRRANSLGVRYTAPARLLRKSEVPTAVPLAAKVIPGAVRTFGRKA